MTKRLAPNIHDRNRGQALPSGLTDEGFARLRTVLDRRRTAAPAPAPAPAADPDPFERRRFASVAEVSAAGFRRVASGFYQEAQVGPKKAHPIWELRAAEEGEGYELVRRREERAVDLRRGSGAGPGTAAAVAAGIVRIAAKKCDKCGLGLAKDQTTSSCPRCKGTGKYKDEHIRNTNPKKASYAIDPARDMRRRGGPEFQVSLLQTPGGDTTQRRTLFSNQAMDLEGLERLIGELKAGPMDLTFDTWTDGEWEIRVRGPRGQLIHEYESTNADEIGGAKGKGLIDTLSSIMGGGGGGESEGEAPLPELENAMEDATGGAPPAEGAPPPDAGASGGMPEAGPLAPSAAALRVNSHVLVVKNGQIADAVVVMIRPHDKALDVVFGGGETGVVSMGDLIDPVIDMDDGGSEDDGPAPHGSGDETIIEVGSEELDAGHGGAGHDPFDAFAREAARRIAVDFGSAFLPGGRVDVVAPFRSFYQKQPVYPGESFMMDGFHRGQQDPEYGFQKLQDPIPGADPFKNLRIRLVSEQSGRMLLVTLEELDRYFGTAQGEAGEGDVDSVPEMPGESVFDESEPVLEPTLIRPRVEQPINRPSAPAQQHTNVSRPGVGPR